MTNDTTKKLISVQQAMEMMGVGRTTFYEEVKRGKITLKRFGARKTLVPLEAVLDWIDALPVVGGDDV